MKSIVCTFHLQNLDLSVGQVWNMFQHQMRCLIRHGLLLLRIVKTGIACSVSVSCELDLKRICDLR